MPQFEFQNGFVSVDDKSLDIDESSVTGIKQWYRDRKSTFIILTLTFAIYVVLGIYDLWPAREVLAILLVSVVAMLFAWSPYYFGIFEGQATTIPRESIKEARYRSMDRLGWSQITIIYAEQNDNQKQIKERDIQLSFPLMGGNDRLESAIAALRKAGIKTREEESK